MGEAVFLRLYIDWEYPNVCDKMYESFQFVQCNKNGGNYCLSYANGSGWLNGAEYQIRSNKSQGNPSRYSCYSLNLGGVYAPK